MTPAALKEHLSVTYPKALCSIVTSIGGLAVFLFLASSILVSQPIGSAVRGYFYSLDNSRELDLLNGGKEPIMNSQGQGEVAAETENLSTVASHRNHSGINIKDDVHSERQGSFGSSQRANDDEDDPKRDKDVNQDSRTQEKDGSFDEKHQKEGTKSGANYVVSKAEHLYTTEEMNANNSSIHSNGNTFENAKNPLQGPTSNSSILREQVDVNADLEHATTMSPLSANISEGNLVDSGCDLFQGKWVHDSAGPLYRNDSCPVLTQMQNCQGNGRPDRDYENWRWKPAQCELPHFDAKKFLELMRGKTLAYVGDSVARNQMESMLCILWQVEVPKNRGNKKMQRYYFRSTSTTVVRIWSSWLVHQTSDAFDFAPAGVTKLHLDAPDEGFMEFIEQFDVIVLSSGHWFAKQSVYILNNEIVGGQLWWPDNSRKKKINNVEAFGISVETILTSMVTHPNYTGLTIVRSYSPDHYEGGAWNTGGSCTGKERPASDNEFVENEFTNIMHEKQVSGFNRAVKKQTNKSKLRLMDITRAFGYRHDGHPGPYRNLDPNKITKRGPDGRPPPQDCLHWCMPGPVDTWNEMVLEVIRREFEERRDVPS